MGVGEVKSRLFQKIEASLGSLDPQGEMNLLAYGYGVIFCSLVLFVWMCLGPRDIVFAGGFGAFLTAVTTGLIKKKGYSESTPPEAEKP